jgi:hypothetical protein
MESDQHKLVLPQLRQTHAVREINVAAHRIAQSAHVRVQTLRPCSYGGGCGRSFENGHSIHAIVPFGLKGIERSSRIERQSHTELAGSNA